jgi:hypothetical protein
VLSKVRLESGPAPEIGPRQEELFRDADDADDVGHLCPLAPVALPV